MHHIDNRVRTNSLSLLPIGSMILIGKTCVSQEITEFNLRYPLRIYEQLLLISVMSKISLSSPKSVSL